MAKYEIYNGDDVLNIDTENLDTLIDAMRFKSIFIKARTQSEVFEAVANELLTLKHFKAIVGRAEAEHPYKIACMPETYSDYNQGWSDACQRIESLLK